MREDDADDAENDRAEEGREEVVDLQPVSHPGYDVQHERVDDEGEDAERKDVERKGEEHDYGPDDRVHNAEDQACHHRGGEVRDMDAVHDERGHVERHGVDGPPDQQPDHRASLYQVGRFRGLLYVGYMRQGGGILSLLR